MGEREHTEEVVATIERRIAEEEAKEDPNLWLTRELRRLKLALLRPAETIRIKE